MIEIHILFSNRTLFENSIFPIRESTKSMGNIMVCKRYSFSGILGGARETHGERVSHALNKNSLC